LDTDKYWEEHERNSKESGRITELVSGRNQDRYERTLKDNKDAFIVKFGFHDCRVISCRKKGKDLIIMLDNSNTMTNVNRVTIKDCNILKQDKPLYGAWWIYEEIYRSDNGCYEIHCLLCHRNQKDFIDFIFTTSGVEYNYSEEW